MTSSSWQTARHRIGVTNFHYTPAVAGLAARFPTGPAGCTFGAVRSWIAVPVVLLLATASTAAQQLPVFRGGVDLATFGVTVTDRKGNLISNLTAGDFEVFEDGQRQTVRYFAPGGLGAGPEMHVGVLLDVSESMGEDIGFTKTAAIKFLNTLTDAVDITLVDFDTEVRVTRYGQNDFARLVERVRLQKAGGMTALYDAIGVYLDGAAGQPGRKVMLLYTDGGDTQSAMHFGELLDLLKASDVTVYAIGELEHLPGAGRGSERRLLEQIADATGGRAFFPTAVRDLDQMYANVVAEIRAQYTLGYLSTDDRADGAWRKVEIRVAGPDGREYRVRARKGYFGPYRQGG
jgi:Ca-activated chloride channel family protein